MWLPTVDFESFSSFSKYSILLDLFSNNVKMCKSLCKFLQIGAISVRFRGSCFRSTFTSVKYQKMILYVCEKGIQPSKRQRLC